MKKIITIVLFFAAVGVQAQSYKQNEGVSLGVELGLNVSNLSGNHSYLFEGYEMNSRAGLNLGVFVDIPILESLYVKSGLYFTQRGCKYEDYDSFFNGQTNKMTLSYFQVPILASYRYNLTRSTQLQLNLGPYLAYAVGGKVKTEDKVVGRVTESDEKIFSNTYCYMNRFDAGLHIGAGLTIGHFMFGLAYEFGLTNNYNKDYAYSWSSEYYDYEDFAREELLPSEHCSIHNNSFILKVGIKF